jgi:hypothetical protein
MLVKLGGIIIQEIKMKRKHKHKKIFKLTIERIRMIEDRYYSKFNTNYYR